MQRFTVLGCCLLTVVVVCHATFALASKNELEMRVPMGTLVLEPPQSVEPKRALVQFPHSKHFSEVSCYTCHHKWDETNSSMSCMASNCHNLTFISSGLKKDTQKTSKDEYIRYYKAAYHKQCLGCHKSLKEKAEKTEHSISSLTKKSLLFGPTGCIECHPK